MSACERCGGTGCADATPDDPCVVDEFTFPEDHPPCPACAGHDVGLIQ